MKKLFTIILGLSIIFSMSYATVPVFADSGTAISSAEEFMAIENNPSESYYLTKDIELPANTMLFTKTAFSGSLDGKGHSIKNLTFTKGGSDIALFSKANGAKFINISLTGVNTNIKHGWLTYGTLVGTSTNCTFSKITVSGSITANISEDESPWLRIGGIVATGSGKFDSCTNKTTIQVIGKSLEDGMVGGLAAQFSGNLSKSANSGSISFTTTDLKFFTEDIEVGGLIGSGSNTAIITSCKNSGSIASSTSYPSSSGTNINVNGISNTSKSVTSCYNTGKINVTLNGTTNCEMNVSGLVGYGKSISKSYNKGSITCNINGTVSNSSYIGGIAATGRLSQCYNKGAIKASSKGSVNVGGLAGETYEMHNSYNVGKVTLSGKGNIGGLAGYASVTGSQITCNYSKATISGSSASAKGTLIGYNTGSFKRNIYNNYYTSGKPYGNSNITWKDWKATGIKVTSLTKSKCSKLSSKYWTYSSKYKRMILKNNKES